MTVKSESSELMLHPPSQVRCLTACPAPFVSLDKKELKIPRKDKMVLRLPSGHQLGIQTQDLRAGDPKKDTG